MKSYERMISSYLLRKKHSKKRPAHQGHHSSLLLSDSASSKDFISDILAEKNPTPNNSADYVSQRLGARNFSTGQDKGKHPKDDLRNTFFVSSNKAQRKRPPFNADKESKKNLHSNSDKKDRRPPHPRVNYGSKVHPHTLEKPDNKALTKTNLNPASRKVDAETLQYFAEISSLLNSQSVDTEERATLIENALEETHGKESELACEKACSRVLEVLIVSSNATQVASFLHRLSPSFVLVSNDAAGSHVIEALLKAVAVSLRSYDAEAAWFKTLNQALTLICKVVDDRLVDMMCNSYGSHVLRSLLSVLSGIALEGESKRRGGHFGGLLGRLSFAEKPEKQGAIIFPDLLRSLTDKILEAAKRSSLELVMNHFGSPVFQVLLKVLEGDDSKVKAIGILLGCNNDTSGESTIADILVENLRHLMLDKSGSHLVEGMLEVAPDSVYVQIFKQILSPPNVLNYSLHQSANFVVQALIVSTRKPDQVDLLVAELKSNFWPLIKGNRSGIITSLLQACKKFQCNEQEICRSLAKAMNPDPSSSSVLVPRLLFLESFAKSNGSKDWKPVFGQKMSVIGCAMLQLIFGYPQEASQQFWLSLVGLEPVEVLATIKDPGGCHVLESFLSSGVAWKHKNRVLTKLKGQFAELASSTSSAFTLEKCFAIGKMDLKEAIVSEMVPIREELAKAKHGPHLIKKFDVTGYSKMPSQWQARMTAKEGTLKAFADVFNSDCSFQNRRQNNKRKAVVVDSSHHARLHSKKRKDSEVP